MIGHFKLGFANRKLGLTLPDKNRKAGADLRGRLQRLGILRAESGHEHMNGSVVFPIFSLAGDVLGMYGRKINDNLREGTPMHLYLPGPHRGVWNEEALLASKEIILCESIIDALTFWCAGFRNVTASYGVNGFTDDHRAAFQKHGIQQRVDRLRPRRSRRRGGRAAKRRTGKARHRFASRAVSERHGRQRIRAEGTARAAESGGAVEPRRVVGGTTQPKERPAAKEKSSEPEPIRKAGRSRCPRPWNRRRSPAKHPTEQPIETTSVIEPPISKRRSP